MPCLPLLVFLFNFFSKDIVLFQSLWVSVVTKECGLGRFLQEGFLGTEHCKHKKIDFKCLELQALTSG